MGPFELMNVTGIPIALHGDTLGEAFSPPHVPADKLKARARQARREISGFRSAKFEAIAARLLAVTFFATALVDDGVGTIEDTDIGARSTAPAARAFEQSTASASRRPAISSGRSGCGGDRGRPVRIGAPTSPPVQFVRSEIEDGVATLTVRPR